MLISAVLEPLFQSCTRAERVLVSLGHSGLVLDRVPHSATLESPPRNSRVPAL